MEKLKNGSVEKIGGTSLWRVVTPFYWILDYTDREGWMIVANQGFECNYGSIPSLFRVFFDPTRYNSYVIHDKAYNVKIKYNYTTDEYMPITRKEADMALLEGITYEGAGFIERFCIYFGVRLFGWIAWNS